MYSWILQYEIETYFHFKLQKYVSTTYVSFRYDSKSSCSEAPIFYIDKEFPAGPFQTWTLIDFVPQFSASETVVRQSLSLSFSKSHLT